ncbi:MAG: hypothetical protein M1834_004282 [Cirrosporium novae-zelandiae]|nr:MAG: hypothetical protein M1834_004282 [Cirrosporium novae-zelandiae]
MPVEGKSNPSALYIRAFDFRSHCTLKSWFLQGQSEYRKKRILPGLSKDHQNNTTRGVTPGLIDPKLERFGNWVHFPLSTKLHRDYLKSIRFEGQDPENEEDEISEWLRLGVSNGSLEGSDEMLAELNDPATYSVSMLARQNAEVNEFGNNEILENIASEDPNNPYPQDQDVELQNDGQG